MVLRHYYLAHQVASGRAIEEPEIAALPLLVKPDMDVLDIGANIGGYTRELCRLAKTVTAFEPIPANFAVLTAAVHSPNLKALPCAVGAFCGETEMVIPPTIQGYYMARFDDGREGQRTNVKVVTLDSLGIAPQFIKCDVEGAEGKVIEGAKELIRAHHPAWLMEVSRPKTGPTIGIMRELGYAPHVWDDGLRRVEGFVGGHENYFFL